MLEIDRVAAALVVNAALSLRSIPESTEAGEVADIFVQASDMHFNDSFKWHDLHFSESRDILGHGELRGSEAHPIVYPLGTYRSVLKAHKLQLPIVNDVDSMHYSICIIQYYF